MANMSVDVSIIIVNYHTKSLVCDCIKSVKKYTEGVRYEIIVVDNASENISELEADGVRIIQLDKNLGFGGANNKAVEISNGKKLFFLNPDTVLLNNSVKILSDAIEGFPDCGVCGGNLYDVDLKPAHSYYYCTMSLKYVGRCAAKSLSKLYDISNQHNFGETPKTVDYITGADLMITKDLFEKIGGYNSDIFMYYEDVDLCQKVRALGKKCYSIPQAHIQHLEGQSFHPSQTEADTIRRRKQKMSGESIAIFLKSNYSPLHYRFIIKGHLLLIRFKLLLKGLESTRQQLDYYKYIESKL